MGKDNSGNRPETETCTDPKGLQWNRGMECKEGEFSYPFDEVQVFELFMKLGGFDSLRQVVGTVDLIVVVMTLGAQVCPWSCGRN